LPKITQVSSGVLQMWAIERVSVFFVCHPAYRRNVTAPDKHNTLFRSQLTARPTSTTNTMLLTQIQHTLIVSFSDCSSVVRQQTSLDCHSHQPTCIIATATPYIALAHLSVSCTQQRIRFNSQITSQHDDLCHAAARSDKKSDFQLRQEREIITDIYTGR